VAVAADAPGGQKVPATQTPDTADSDAALHTEPAGHAVGALTPAPQNEPAGHAICVAEVELCGQYDPAWHAPDTPCCETVLQNEPTSHGTGSPAARLGQ
jgi:hypothetical protein